MAIKVLKAEHVDSELQREFAQEVYIMRFVVLNLHAVTIRSFSTCEMVNVKLDFENYLTVDHVKSLHIKWYNFFIVGPG